MSLRTVLPAAPAAACVLIEVIFALAWGDEGHRKGWCLYKMGCKGPDTYSGCSVDRWNNKANWCIGAGAPCIGCAQRKWADNGSPFLVRTAGVGPTDTVYTPGPFATSVAREINVLAHPAEKYYWSGIPPSFHKAAAALTVAGAQ